MRTSFPPLNSAGTKDLSQMSFTAKIFKKMSCCDKNLVLFVQVVPYIFLAFSVIQVCCVAIFLIILLRFPSKRNPTG